MVTAQTQATRQARSQAPIPTRKPSFDFDAIDQRYWYGGNGIITAVISALSATFPPGEKEFVRSVMHYRGEITDETLREQMRGFASQEGQHAYQHRRANEWLDAHGFAASEIVERVEKNIAVFVKANPPAVHLASTVSLEHITAILAHYMLTTPEATAPAPEPIRELLLWHAVEEIEHKAVAFDVFEAVSGDREMLRRVFLLTTIFFSLNIAAHAVHSMKSVGYRPTLKDIGGALKFFVGPKGIFPNILASYRDFLRKDFHPWDHDNRELVEEWQAKRAAA